MYKRGAGLGSSRSRRKAHSCSSTRSWGWSVGRISALPQMRSNPTTRS